jgi:hypothetical protein
MAEPNKITLESFHEHVNALVQEFAANWAEHQKDKKDAHNWPATLTLPDWFEQFDAYLETKPLDEPQE